MTIKTVMLEGIFNGLNPNAMLESINHLTPLARFRIIQPAAECEHEWETIADEWKDRSLCYEKENAELKQRCGEYEVLNEALGLSCTNNEKLIKTQIGEIKELKQQLEDCRIERMAGVLLLEIKNDQLAGAQKQNDDAARYQWLRDKSNPDLCGFYLSVGLALKGVSVTPDFVDSTIDAAIFQKDQGAAEVAK